MTDRPRRSPFEIALVVGALAILAMWVVGPFVIRSGYAGTSLGPVNEVFAGRATNPLSAYLGAFYSAALTMSLVGGAALASLYVTRTRRDGVIRTACVVVLSAASGALAALIARTMAARLMFPFELSKMEGGLVEHVRLAATGDPLFAAPTEHFAAFLYTPGLYWVTAPLMAMGVDGFLAARLVGLVALAGATLLGMHLVRKGTVEPWLPLVVPALVLARYFDVNAFYDQARADNLMVLFLVISVTALAMRPSRTSLLIFGLSGLLAFWTKQSTLVLYAALLVGYAAISWRSAAAAALVLFGLVGVSFAVANAITGGWLYAYTIDAPGYHSLDNAHLIEGLRAHIFGSFGIHTTLIGLTALALVNVRWTAGREDDTGRARFMVVVAGLATLGYTVASLWQPISIENVLVPYAVVSAFALPVVVSWGIGQLDLRHRDVAWSLAIVLFCVVVVRGFRSPVSFEPSDDDAAEWAALATRAEMYGPRDRVWVTLHGSPWGGKMDEPRWIHVGALCDLVGGYFGEVTRYEVPEGLLDLIDQQHWSAVLIADWDRRAEVLLTGRYEPDPGDAGFRLPAFTGYGAALERFWVPTADADRPYDRQAARIACGAAGSVP